MTHESSALSKEQHRPTQVGYGVYGFALVSQLDILEVQIIP